LKNTSITDSNKNNNNFDNKNLGEYPLIKKAYISPKLIILKTENTASGSQGVFETDGGPTNAS